MLNLCFNCHHCLCFVSREGENGRSQLHLFRSNASRLNCLNCDLFDDYDYDEDDFLRHE